MRNWTTPLALISLATSLGACGKPPEDADPALVATVEQLFAAFEDEDPAVMIAGLEDLRSQIEDTDMSLDVQDRAATLPVLKGDNLGSLSIPDGVSADDQIPVALIDRSSHGVDDHIQLALEPNRVCIESDTTVWARRSFVTDDACWADQSCDRLETTNEVRKENFLAKVWYNQNTDFRMYELEDGTRVLVSRGYLKRQYLADNENNSWDQTFSLDVTYDEGNTSLRWGGFWSSITVGGLGDDLYSALVRDGLQQGNVFADEFISGVQEECKLDRNAEKPEGGAPAE